MTVAFTSLKTVHEPARDVPVIGEFDLCIIGGSCTGVFAAVRAAQLGLTVALVEQNILLGGMATAAQVNEWHSLHDVAGKRQIIGGLTNEILGRLERRQAVSQEHRPRGPFYRFNSAELALELDQLVREHPIQLFLKASCVSALRDGDRITSAIIEDKSGRRALQARMFIDASGDGDLLRRAGFAAWKNDSLQPVSYQILAAGIERIHQTTGGRVWNEIQHLLQEFSYPTENAVPWIHGFAAPADLSVVYGPRLNGIDASDAGQLTAAVMESRRCHRALLDMMRRAISPKVAAVALAHSLGIRETWHARCHYRLSADDLLSGRTFHDYIGAGTYPVDVHSPEGTLLRYLDGREELIGKTSGTTWRRWRDMSAPTPPCYQIPYRSLVPESAQNLLVAGRLLDADREAFGGVRVMVNMNQTGEAAGAAAFLALRRGLKPAELEPALIRSTLAEHGSIML